MKENFITFILIMIIFGIIACVVILGINIYNDTINNSNTATSLQEWFGNTVQTAKKIINIEDDGNISQIIESDIQANTSTSESNNQQNIQASESDIQNNYFYNQLDEASKIIYNGLQNNKENLKTGTYSIQYGDSFSNILSANNGQEILGDYYQSAIEAFLYDNPDVFYINPNKMFLNVESTTYKNNKTYNVFINNGDKENYLADGFTSKEQIEQCENLIDSVTNQILSKATGSNYDKAKKIHDLLVNNLTYDSSVSKNNIYNIYGALVNRECVCEGYAKSYKYLLNKVGIKCVIVIGTATNSSGKTENHSWNYIELDGNWYAVDVTWDDPVVLGNGGISAAAKYKYFLKGYNSINQDHTAIGQFTEGGKEFKYPSLSTQDY